MAKRALRALVFLAASSSSAATPVTDAVFTADPLPSPAQAGRLVVKVNGVQVFPAGAAVKVRATGGFDQVDAWFDRRHFEARAHLEPGRQYRVRLNACSQYELLPVLEPKGDATVVFRVAPGVLGPIRFTGTSSEVVLAPGASSERLPHEGHGAMCAYAADTFTAFLASSDEGHPKALRETRFIFLADEHLVVSYPNTKGKALKLELEPPR
jgi:hypothetical protein